LQAAAPRDPCDLGHDPGADRGTLPMPDSSRDHSCRT
jgi:hypothetical protein